MSPMNRTSLALYFALVCAACDEGSLGDAGAGDASTNDGAADAAPLDATSIDAAPDAGQSPEDAASPDAPAPDAQRDAETPFDAGEDLRNFRTPELVEVRDMESADAPSLAMGANGDVIVVWVQ